MSKQMASDFSKAFQEAGGFGALSYSNLVRFIAVMSIIMAVLWSMNHFMSEEAKRSESFMVQMGTRVVRLAVGLILSIIFLTI